jgi:hypothetical protein
LVAIFKKKVFLNLLYKNHKKAKELLQNPMAQNHPDLSMLGREDSSTVNISKKKKKKMTRKQKVDQIKVEGIVEEDMNALEVEDSDQEATPLELERPEDSAPRKEDLEEFKEYLMRVMTENGFDKERASKMHWSRFLELLQILNANQIYFR